MNDDRPPAGDDAVAGEPPAWRLVADAVAGDGFVSATLSGARRGTSPSGARVALRPVDLRAGRHLQVTTSDGRRNEVANVAMTAARDHVVALLREGYADAYVRTLTGDLQLRHSKKGAAHVSRHRPTADTIDTSHDRTKARPVGPDAPFLRALGITDDRPRVRSGKRAKYRQVERFLEIVVQTWPDAWDRPLRVVDLGCGAGALTLAAHHLVRREAPGSSTLGVDVREDLVERLGAVAADLGWDDIEFRAAEIASADLGSRPPDLVLALHACDTATDDALARAVRAGARVILAAPCCQHDLQAQLDQRRTPAGFEPLVRDGIVRERLGDLLTDALRAELLRAHGYRTDVIEFVATEHTAKNLMIRAVRRDRRDPADEREAAAAAARLADAWGVTPALARRLPVAT